MYFRSLSSLDGATFNLAAGESVLTAIQLPDSSWNAVILGTIGSPPIPKPPPTMQTLPPIPAPIFPAAQPNPKP